VYSYTEPWDAVVPLLSQVRPERREVAFIGPIIRGGDAELLHRIEGPQDGGEGIALFLSLAGMPSTVMLLDRCGRRWTVRFGYTTSLVDALVIAGISYAACRLRQIRNVRLPKATA